MIKISLSQGLRTVIDDEDLHLVEGFIWCALKAPKGKFYAVRNRRVAERENGLPRLQYMHSLITGFDLTDHCDGDGLNNVRANLRMATSAQNNMNRRPSSGCGYKGVTFDKARNSFLAAIKVDGKRKFLGRFHDVEEAARTYDIAAGEIFGEFAWLNFGGSRD